MIKDLIKYYKYLLEQPRIYPAATTLNCNIFPIFLGFITLVIILSLFILKSPILILSLIFIISLTSLLDMIPSTWNNTYSRANILQESLIRFLVLSGIMRYLYFIYIFWYQFLTDFGFKRLYILLHVGAFCYVILIRYIFYLKISFIIIPWYIYLLYVFFFLFMILRFLTNISTYFCVLLSTKYFTYNEILLSQLPEEIPLKEQASSNPSRSVFSYHSHQHQHQHNYPPFPPRSRLSINTKWTFAVITTGLGIWAGVNYQRSADAAEVQAGLMTPEEFHRKHPKNNFTK